MHHFILIINSLVYVFFFLRNYKKKGFDITSYIIAIYGFVAIMGVVLSYHPSTTIQSGNINILSLLFFFVAFLITLKPVKDCTIIKRTNLVPPQEIGLKAFIIFVAVITVMRLPSLISNLSQNLMLMLLDTSYLSGQYEELANSGPSGFSTGSFNIIPILGGMIDVVAVFLLMYYLSRPNRKKWITIVLAVASLISPLGALVQARRGAMVFTILSFLAYYILFKNCYTQKIKKIVKRAIIIIISVIAFGTTLITISRFTKSYMADDYASYSVIYYIGQPMVYFCETIDPNGCRYGDRTIPLFKSIVTDGAYSYSERISKYSNMNIGEEVFSTYFGEILLDFGPILGFVFLLFLVGFLYMLGPGKRRKIQFYELIPVIMIIDLLICGWTQSPFSDIGGNLHFVFMILMYLYFRLMKPQEDILNP